MWHMEWYFLIPWLKIMLLTRFWIIYNWHISRPSHVKHLFFPCIGSLFYFYHRTLVLDAFVFQWLLWPHMTTDDLIANFKIRYHGLCYAFFLFLFWKFETEFIWLVHEFYWYLQPCNLCWIIDELYSWNSWSMISSAPLPELSSGTTAPIFRAPAQYCRKFEIPDCPPGIKTLHLPMWEGPNQGACPWLVGICYFVDDVIINKTRIGPNSYANTKFWRIRIWKSLEMAV